MKADFHRQAGFTLIEILFVCGVIGILSAMALPTLIMAKQAAEASSAIGSLRTINSSQLGFSASCGNGYYSPDFMTLGIIPPASNSPFISPDLSYANSPVKSGYTFQMMGTAAPTAPATCNGLAAGNASKSYKVGADPGVPSNFRFFASNSGETIYENNATFYAAMPEVGAPPVGQPIER
jgi:prepilin-type N-terminal cleavage/methylation domain-containing protein